MFDFRELFSGPNHGINFDKYEDIPVVPSGSNIPKAIENVSLSSGKCVLQCEIHLSNSNCSFLRLIWDQSFNFVLTCQVTSSQLQFKSLPSLSYWTREM